MNTYEYKPHKYTIFSIKTAFKTILLNRLLVTCSSLRGQLRIYKKNINKKTNIFA